MQHSIALWLASVLQSPQLFTSLIAVRALDTSQPHLVRLHLVLLLKQHALLFVLLEQLCTV